MVNPNTSPFEQLLLAQLELWAPLHTGVLYSGMILSHLTNHSLFLKPDQSANFPEKNASGMLHLHEHSQLYNGRVKSTSPYSNGPRALDFREAKKHSIYLNSVLFLHRPVPSPSTTHTTLTSHTADGFYSFYLSVWVRRERTRAF